MDSTSRLRACERRMEQLTNEYFKFTNVTINDKTVSARDKFASLRVARVQMRTYLDNLLDEIDTIRDSDSRISIWRKELVTDVLGLMSSTE